MSDDDPTKPGYYLAREQEIAVAKRLARVARHPMSEPTIDLADLRDLIAETRAMNPTAPLELELDYVLAFVELAEAAHAYLPLPDQWNNGEDRLDNALAKFSFSVGDGETR